METLSGYIMYEQVCICVYLTTQCIVYTDLVNGTFDKNSHDWPVRGEPRVNVVNDFSRHPKECCGGRVECVYLHIIIWYFFVKI